jgi:hypothetical protein
MKPFDRGLGRDGRTAWDLPAPIGAQATRRLGGWSMTAICG